MKFVRNTLLCAVALISATAYAGLEEICYKHAEQSVQMKNMFQADPSYLKTMLDRLEADTLSKPKMKESVRNRIFFVYNRKDVPDDIMRQISFTRCLHDAY